MDAVTADCAQLRVNLGAYVLGALDAAGRAQLETHLGDCPGCRDELVSLAALPGLLARVDPTVLDSSLASSGPVPGEPATGAPVQRSSSSELLAQRAIAQLRGRRRRTWIAGVAAAAVVVGVIAGATEVRQLATGSQTVSASDPTSHISARVRMHASASGTVMSVELIGAAEEQRCALVAVGTDGRRETAATWEATYTGEARVDGQTAIAMRDISALEIVTLDGHRLVRLPV